MTDQSVRKNQIMEKAKELFAEKGYHPVTMEQVADACGVAKGTVYLYFVSKADLFIEIFVEAHKTIMGQVRKMMGSGKGFVAVVSEIFDYFEEIIRGDKFFMRFGKVQKGLKGIDIPHECFRKIHESVAEIIDAVEEEAVNVLRKYLPGSKVNLKDLYEIVVALILGVEESESKTIKNTALSVLLDGVRKEVKC
jgi:AcrR family transcriptional regulator